MRDEIGRILDDEDHDCTAAAHGDCFGCLQPTGVRADRQAGTYVADPGHQYTTTDRYHFAFARADGYADAQPNGYADAQPDGCAYGHSRAYGDLNPYACTADCNAFADAASRPS